MNKITTCEVCGKEMQPHDLPNHQKTSYVYYYFDGGTVEQETTEEAWLVNKSNDRRNRYVLSRTVSLDGASVEVKGEDVLEIVDDELQCPICDMVCKSEAGLKSHKRSHEDTPHR